MRLIQKNAKRISLRKDERKEFTYRMQGKYDSAKLKKMLDESRKNCR